MHHDDEPGRAKLTNEHSVEMLKAVMDGETYDRVARRFSVTRTAVERRVKATVRQLIAHVGIEGMTLQHSGYVHRIRQHRDDVLIALSRFEPSGHVAARSEGRVVSEIEVLMALKRIAARSSWPMRDQALFYILFVTGARPLEIARLCVHDYLNPDGSVRAISELRAQVAITGKARPLYFTNARFDDLMAAYLQDRRGLFLGLGQQNNHAQTQTALRTERTGGDIQGLDGADYRGFDPDSPLFVTSQGEGFAIFEYGQGGQQRFLCRPILELYRKIFRQAELQGVSPLTVRQTVAARLYERGADEEQVGLLLGLGDKGAVRERFPRPKRCMQDLVRD